MLSLITKGILSISKQTINQYYELPLEMEIDYFNNPLKIETPNLIIDMDRLEVELFLTKEE